MRGAGARDRAIAAALLFVAAALHVVAAFDPEHAGKQLFFVFFWAVVVAQSIAGVAILRGGVAVTLAVMALNGLLILGFVVTRFVPVPGEGMAEPIEALGVIANTIEAATLPFLVRILRRMRSPVLRGQPA